MGRPTKRTPQVEEAAALALTKGYTRKAAAAAAGINYATMREWELKFPEFADLLEKAESAAQTQLLDTIQRHSRIGAVTTRPDGTVIESPGAWQAAAWILERRWPEAYAHRAKVEMTLDITGEARKVAESLGLDEATVLDEAEAILAGKR